MTEHAQPRPVVGVVAHEGAHSPGPAAASPRAARRLPRGVRLVARLAAVLFGLLLPLLLLEVALRFFGPFLPGNYDTGALVRRHPILGHFHTPSFRGWTKTPRFTVQVDYNPMGLRDPRQSYAKLPGTYRVLALGDSYVEAVQVQAHETVSAQLERLLGAMASRPVEVINAGVFGYGTTQEYLLLDLEGPQYQPDLVLLFFCHCNDVANNNYRLELIDSELSRALKPYFDLPDGSDELQLIPPPPPSPRTSLRERLRDSSLLYNVIESGVVYRFELPNPQEPFNGIDGLIDPTRGKYDSRPSGEWERAWRITEATLVRMRDRAAELGAPLVIVGVPEWRMLERAYWQRDANKRLVDSGKGGPEAPVALLDGIAQRLGVPHIDLRPVFQPRVDADGLHRYYLEGDYHWTSAGHVVAAEAVAVALAERGLVPR